MIGFGKRMPNRFGKRIAMKRTAFTLVELLVVIVIIAILIALLVPTIGGALYATKNAQIGLEISNLAQAMEAYRSDVGSYPPDFANANPVVDKVQIDTHLARNYRYRVPPQDQVVVDNLDPAEALVFWLRGLSKDKKRPLTGAGDRIPFFEFNQARLDDRDGDGFPEYYPKNSEMPLVYLHHANYGVVGKPANVVPILNGSVQIRAYASEVAADGVSVARFAEAEKFQIISAGQDNDFGMNGAMQPVYNDGRGYTDADKDNLASFSEGKTLEDAMP